MAEQEKQVTKFDELLAAVKALTGKVSDLEQDNQQLKAQVATSKGKRFKVTSRGVESQWSESLEDRNRYAEQNPPPIVLIEEVGFKGKKDCCPFCTKNSKDSLLDLVPKSGRYQCRRCGKTWKEKNLGVAYTLQVEQDY